MTMQAHLTFQPVCIFLSYNPAVVTSDGQVNEMVEGLIFMISGMSLVISSTINRVCEVVFRTKRNGLPQVPVCSFVCKSFKSGIKTVLLALHRRPLRNL